MSEIQKKILSGVLYSLLTVGSLATSGLAIKKVFIDSKPTPSNLTNTNQTVQTVPSTTSTATEVLAQNVPANTITLAQLATHNKRGDCYIAYNGTLYDVSDRSEWSNCQHHGIKGGSDITTRFPHPTGYLATLPVVGKLAAQETVTANPNQNSSGDDDSDDQFKGNDDDNDDDDNDENETEWWED